MPVKHINNGRFRTVAFDNDCAAIRPAQNPAPGLEWHDLELRTAGRAIIAPKDVRFFQRMESPGLQTSNHWKFDFLRRMFC
jgi:hypothetical protein